MTTITTQANHERFAYVVNLLMSAREARLGKGLNPSIDYASRAEVLAEKALVGLCSDLQCTRWADDLLTAWEGSLATNPLELPEWQALIYREGSSCSEDDLDQLIVTPSDNELKGWSQDYE